MIDRKHAICSRCDQKIYDGETAFGVRGEIYCPDCFKDYMIEDFLWDLEDAAREVGIPFWTVGKH